MEMSSLSPPKQAYLFFPKIQQHKTSFDKNGNRWFFFGQIQYDQYQQSKLKQYFQYLDNKQLHHHKWFDFQRILLFLAGNSYKSEETYKSIEEYWKWRTQSIPVKLTNKALQFLVFRCNQQKGLIYLSGRDHKFRPVYVLNVTLDVFKAQNIHDIQLALTMFYQTIIDQMMLPGQVQNWIAIFDLNNHGITQLPLNAGKNIMAFLQNTYRGRLYKLYVVNTPKAVTWTWKIIKGFLEQTTIQKINFYSKKPENIFELVNVNQLQKKYGGTLQQFKHFWPPKIANSQSLPENPKYLIKQNKYKEMFKEGKLSRNKICNQIIENI